MKILLTSFLYGETESVTFGTGFSVDACMNDVEKGIFAARSLSRLSCSRLGMSQCPIMALWHYALCNVQSSMYYALFDT